MSTLSSRASVASVAALSLVTSSLLLAGGAHAAPPGSKVRICHASNSMTNPYVSIEVAESSVDGNAGNNKGQGDHYLTHTGPVWTPDASKKTGWGDIIPPIPGIHDGLNWTPLGQAIWSAGCQPAKVTDTDNDNIPDVIDPDTDGDKIPDATDPDDDNDGTTDTSDPDESNTTDTDKDGVPDATDSDDNGDGLTDDAACNANVAIEEPPLPPATPSETGSDPVNSDPAGTETDTSADTPGNNAATGVGQTTNGAGATREGTKTGETCGTPVETPDVPTDTDGDGIPNATDTDDDGDGKPDNTDSDHDGDGIPDREDADDDGDGIPDVLDEDHTGPEQDPDTTDTDGDGTPDVTDRDDDGDGVTDTVDADQDGDGTPETLSQPVVTRTLLSTANGDEFTRVFREVPRTNAGQVVSVDVECFPTRSYRAVPFGGGSKDELANYGCDVIPGKNPQLRLRLNEPTTVKVRVQAPAVGPYKALDDTIVRVINPN